MVWNVYDEALEAEAALTIKERVSYQLSVPVLKQPPPAARRDRLRQDHCGELSVLTLLIDLVQEVQQRLNDRPIGGRQDHQRHVRPPALPFLTNTLPGTWLHFNVGRRYVLRNRPSVSDGIDHSPVYAEDRNDSCRNR